MDRVFEALDGEFRTTREVAERAGLRAYQATGLLGVLRGRGLADYRPGVARGSLWRVSGADGNGSREGADELGEDRQVGVQPDLA